MLNKVKRFIKETGEYRLYVKACTWKYKTLPESVLGYYDSRKDIIYINESFKGMDSYVFTILCHELHHRWQYETWGFWKYTLLKIVRPLLERTADQVERKAEKWIGLEGIDSGD